MGELTRPDASAADVSWFSASTPDPGPVSPTVGGFFALPPERRRRFALAALCGLGGVIALVAGWFAVSGTRDVSDQLAYLASGTVLGLVLVALAGATLVADFMAEQTSASEELRASFRSLERIVLAQRSSRAPAGEAMAGEPWSWSLGTPPAGEIDATVVRLGNSNQVHRSSCPLVRGKTRAQLLSSGEAVDAGFVPCRTCKPSLSGVDVRA